MKKWLSLLFLLLLLLLFSLIIWIKRSDIFYQQQAVLPTKSTAIPEPPPTLVISIWSGNQSPEQAQQTVTYSTAARHKNISSSQICVQSGHTAQLTFTRVIPSYDAVFTYTGPAAIEHDKVLTSYFTITPTPQQQNVQLQIALQTSTDKNSHQQEQQLATTITIPFNRWIQITGQNESTDQSVKTYTSQPHRTAPLNYYVRVEKTKDCLE